MYKDLELNKNLTTVFNNGIIKELSADAYQKCSDFYKSPYHYTYSIAKEFKYLLNRYALCDMGVIRGMNPSSVGKQTHKHPIERMDFDQLYVSKGILTESMVHCIGKNPYRLDNLLFVIKNLAPLIENGALISESLPYYDHLDKRKSILGYSKILSMVRDKNGVFPVVFSIENGKNEKSAVYNVFIYDYLKSKTIRDRLASYPHEEISLSVKEWYQYIPHKDAKLLSEFDSCMHTQQDVDVLSNYKKKANWEKFFEHMSDTERYSYHLSEKELLFLQAKMKYSDFNFEERNLYLSMMEMKRSACIPLYDTNLDFYKFVESNYKSEYAKFRMLDAKVKVEFPSVERSFEDIMEKDGDTIYISPLAYDEVESAFYEATCYGIVNSPYMDNHLRVCAKQAREDITMSFKDFEKAVRNVEKQCNASLESRIQQGEPMLDWKRIVSDKVKEVERDCRQLHVCLDGQERKDLSLALLKNYGNMDGYCRAFLEDKLMKERGFVEEEKLPWNKKSPPSRPYGKRRKKYPANRRQKEKNRDEHNHNAPNKDTI